jgi:tetratricopeptide (TPR) repeat protein
MGTIKGNGARRGGKKAGKSDQTSGSNMWLVVALAVAGTAAVAFYAVHDATAAAHNTTKALAPAAKVADRPGTLQQRVKVSLPSIKPIDWRMVMHAAMEQHQNGNTTGAAAILQTAATAADQNDHHSTKRTNPQTLYAPPPGALLMLGQLQHSLGNYDASTAAFERGVAHFPPGQAPAEALYSLGVVREAASDDIAAMRWYRQAIAASSPGARHQPATANLGLLLAKTWAGFSSLSSVAYTSSVSAHAGTAGAAVVEASGDAATRVGGDGTRNLNGLHEARSLLEAAVALNREDTIALQGLSRLIAQEAYNADRDRIVLTEGLGTPVVTAGVHTAGDARGNEEDCVPLQPKPVDRVDGNTLSVGTSPSPCFHGNILSPDTRALFALPFDDPHRTSGKSL